MGTRRGKGGGGVGTKPLGALGQRLPPGSLPPAPPRPAGHLQGLLSRGGATGFTAEARPARPASRGPQGPPLLGVRECQLLPSLPAAVSPSTVGRDPGAEQDPEDWAQRLSCGSGQDRRFQAGRRRVIGGAPRWGAPVRPAGTGRGGAGGMAVSHPAGGRAQAARGGAAAGPGKQSRPSREERPGVPGCGSALSP